MVRWGLLGVVLLLAITTHTTAQESDAPYLYYWSDYHHAFFIERADGTDRRVLGQGLSEGVDALGAGWSPSGEWLAWAASGREWGQGFYNRTDARPYILNIDNRRRVFVADQLANIRDMVWHPHEDILLVTDGLYHNFNVHLIDVNANAIIATYRPDSDLVNMRQVFWQPNGEYAALYFSTEYDRYARTLVMIGLDGQITEQSANRFFNGNDNGLDLAPIFSPDGRLNYVNDDRNAVAFVTNINSEPEFLPVPNGIISSMWWSNTGDYALVSSFRPRESENDRTTVYRWLLDARAMTLQPVTTDVSQNILWAPHRNAIFFHDSQQNAVVYDVDSGTQQVFLADAVLFGWQWLDDNHVVSGAFENEARNDYQAYLYEVNSQTLRVIDVLHDDASFSYDERLALSADLQYEASMSMGATIRNYATGEVVSVDPHSARHRMGYDIGLMRWHPEENWLLAVGDNTVAGGGPNFELWRVANADASVVRELTFCNGSQCANWLPPQVNVDDLPLTDDSLLSDPEPVQIIRTEDFVTSLSWSPDGELLAIGRGFLLGGEYPHWTRIWDVENRVLAAELDETEGATLHWEASPDGSYTAVFEDADPIVEPPFYYTISPDGQQYAASTDYQSGFGVFDSQTDRRLFTFEGLRLPYQVSFSYSPDGELLFGAVHGERIRAWNPHTGALLVMPNVFGTAVAFSPDGEWLAVGAGWHVHIYRANDLLSHPVIVPRTLREAHFTLKLPKMP